MRKLSAERRLGADPARDLAIRQIDAESFAETRTLYLAAKKPEPDVAWTQTDDVDISQGLHGDCVQARDV